MREISVSYNLKKGICVYAVGVQMPTVIRSGDGYRMVQGRRWAWLPETPFFGELVSRGRLACRYCSTVIRVSVPAAVVDAAHRV
jgi:hypothetical protein